MDEPHHKNGRKKDKKKKFLMGNLTTDVLYENQEEDGWTLSRGVYYRFWEYEVYGEMIGLENNRGVFWGRLGSRRSSSATH